MHVVRVRRFQAAGAERTTTVGGWEVRTVLPMTDDVHPFTGVRIETEIGHYDILARVAGVFGIRKMTIADVEPVSAAMARAFFDDPLQVWALPDPATRLGQLERMFALQARFMSVPLGESFTDSTRSCAAYWAPPDRHEPDEAAVAQMTPLGEIVGPDGLVRLQAAFAALRAAIPAERHFYLQGLGTDPPRQGEGLGSAAMQPVLERCDRESIPAYLESTKERNVPFYERHGFVVTGTIVPAPDGPTLWKMWRDPR